MPPVTGQGMVELDIAIFMLTVAAAAVSLITTVKQYRSESRAFAIARLMRTVGWCILSARFGTVLFTTGDILISLPAIIATAFLAAGDISIVFFKGKWVKT